MKFGLWLAAVIIVGGFLVLFASVVRTHTCDVGCNPELDWARGIAIFGVFAGVFAVLAQRKGGSQAATSAGWVLCVTAYVATLALIFVGG
jgi:hypothetical protein